MEGGPPSFPRGFSCPAVLRIRSGASALSPTGLLPSVAGLSRPLRLEHWFVTPCGASYNPAVQARRFGLVPVRSPLLGESRLISSPRATEMFQFTRFPPYGYEFTIRYLAIKPGGLPHSEIPGSAPACGSPRLIAAYHVLHRLLTPRHPPCALCSLITVVSGCCYLAFTGRQLTT